MVLLTALLPVPASAPAMALSSTRLVPLWHADVPVPRGGYAHALTAQGLLVRTSQGVLALGAGDGSVTWRHQITTASATGWDVAPGTVVIDYDRPHPRAGDRRQLVALSSATGRRLWSRHGWSLPPGWRPSASSPGRAPVFLAWHAGRGVLAGVAAGTGRDQWVFRAPAGCTVSGTAARAADAVLLLACGGSPRFLLLDLATGRALRSIPLPEGDAPAFRVAEGVIAVFAGGGMTLYDDLGRAVLHREACWPRCAMARDRGIVLTTYRSGDETVLAATSWPDGREAWEVKPAPAYERLLDGGLAVRSRAQGEFTVVDLIDPGTGAITSYGLPLPGTVLAASGQRIFTAALSRGVGQTGTIRLSTLRRVPWSGGSPLLGGVHPGSWPDACALLSDESFSPAPSEATLSGYAMPRPIGCRFTRQDGARLEVRVLRVAGDADEAADLLGILGDTADYRPVPGAGDQAVADTEPPSMVLVRAGPVLLSVASGHLPVRRRLLELADAVADRVPAADTGERGEAGPRAVPPPRLSLVGLPGTSVTLTQEAGTQSPINAYLLDGHPHVRREETFTRLDHTAEYLSPDGAWGAVTTENYPSSGRDPVTILDTATGSARQIPTVEAPMGVDYPAWSPDGMRLLLTVLGDDKITGFVVIDLATMRPRFVRVRHGGRYSGEFRWGGDSTTVAVQSGSADDDEEDHYDVAFLDLAGGVKRRFTGVGKLLDRQHWMSASGGLFAARCLRPADQICAWRTADGAAAARIPLAPESFVSWYGDDHVLGRQTLSAQEQALAVIDLRGQRLRLLARGAGLDGLKLAIDPAAS